MWSRESHVCFAIGSIKAYVFIFYCETGRWKAHGLRVVLHRFWGPLAYHMMQTSASYEHVWFTSGISRSQSFQWKRFIPANMYWRVCCCIQPGRIENINADSGKQKSRTRMAIQTLVRERLYYRLYSRSTHSCQESTHTSNSVAVLAEIPLRSPRKMFIFIIKKIIYRVKVSIKNMI